MSNPILDVIARKGWCVTDGATGSNFFGRGLEAGYPPELWCVERPDEVLWLHREFLKAGADLILTNSFGANAPRLKLHKSEHRVHEINKAAAQLARQAAAEHADANGHEAVVAGSMGPTGELFAPMGELTHESTVASLPSRQRRSLRGVPMRSGSKRCHLLKKLLLRWKLRRRRACPLPQR